MSCIWWIVVLFARSAHAGWRSVCSFRNFADQTAQGDRHSDQRVDDAMVNILNPVPPCKEPGTELTVSESLSETSKLPKKHTALGTRDSGPGFENGYLELITFWDRTKASRRHGGNLPRETRRWAVSWIRCVAHRRDSEAVAGPWVRSSLT